MAYCRPQSKRRLTKAEKQDLLSQYVKHYRALAKQNLASLNVKIPRKAHDQLLAQVGGLLLAASATAARERGSIRDFLNTHPLPDVLKGLLPDEFRAFCL